MANAPPNEPLLRELVALSLLPESFPPGRLKPKRKVTHFLPDVAHVPAGEARQLLGLACAPIDNCLSILCRSGARVGAEEGMTQHVASLEIRAIASFLEDEIFGEVRVVVADVQP